ncbi:hypothetical protein EDD76_10141 [Kineothrix alysoides]|uniref:DNA-binding protein n=1 Tax=Kineothrix alysoides TaxID=1469948 RepID=A0A4R1R5X7_9FIRM|nr:transposase [Kineothrix alysoides]TCL60944.1 hypothetical protein EDD76_10141 [Kineothrix alysoides]
MEYISTKDTSGKWGLTPRMVVCHCISGRIEGAQKIAGVWLVPKDAQRPEDRRKGNGRKPTAENKERDL